MTNAEIIQHLKDVADDKFYSDEFREACRLAASRLLSALSELKLTKAALQICNEHKSKPTPLERFA